MMLRTCGLLFCLLLHIVQQKMTFPLIISLYCHQSNLAHRCLVLDTFPSSHVWTQINTTHTGIFIYTQAGKKAGDLAERKNPQNDILMNVMLPHLITGACDFYGWKPKIAFLISVGYFISFLVFSHLFSLQCVTVIWRDPGSSRRRASTSVRRTTSVYMAHGATAVKASSQERWSPLWDARTTLSALSAVCAGTEAPWYGTHSIDAVRDLVVGN